MHGKQAKSESWEKCKLKTAKGYDDFQTRYVLLSNSPEDGPRTTGRPATCRYNNKSLARFLAMDTGVVILLLSSSTPCVAFASHDPLPCLAALLLFCPVSRARQAAAAGLGVAHSPLLLRGVWDRLRLANHPPHYPAARITMLARKVTADLRVFLPNHCRAYFHPVRSNHRIGHSYLSRVLIDGAAVLLCIAVHI